MQKVKSRMDAGAAAIYTTTLEEIAAVIRRDLVRWLV